jgi:HEAT repeat protein
LQPNLRRKADGALRHESMRQLAQSRDPLYFEYLEQLYDDERDSGRRASWIRWCADYDSLDALFAMLPLVLETDIRAEGAFMEGLGHMKSKQIGSHVRRRWVEAEEPLLRKGAIRLMTAIPWPGDLGELYRMCSDPDRGVAMQALDGLARSEDPKAPGLLARFVKRDTSRRAAPIVAAALRALWTATKGSDDTVRLAMRLASEALAWQVRATAIQLLGPKNAQRARETLIAAFHDDKRQVRIAAYEAVTWLREPATVVLLIDQLDDEETYVAHFIGDDLADLTGVHLGIEAEAWRRWWQQVADHFECPAKPTAKKRAVASSGTATRYYNIPIRSDNIVFLIDLSGSMGAKVKGVTRLAAAKKELIRVLEQLTPQHHFNIIAFEDAPRPYAEDLRRATKTEIRDAIKYVKKLRVGGATNIYDSLEMAFDMDEVETVFLLTDGAPTAGAIIAKNEILEVMRRDNSYLRVRINTISIGSSGASSSFLEKLANQNWGTAAKQ